VTEANRLPASLTRGFGGKRQSWSPGLRLSPSSPSQFPGDFNDEVWTEYGGGTAPESHRLPMTAAKQPLCREFKLARSTIVEVESEPTTKASTDVLAAEYTV
jgi:hypothetical protein